jgi:cytoskeleton protein RodZ
MTIEGLGKKFQEARLARKLTLDEASRMTKIRPSRLAEIEADDFSQFPSLAYAKGFLLIYGKFLDVDVTPYMEAFEGSDAVTVDGYSYLQDNPAPKPIRPAIVPRRRPSVTPSSSGGGSGKPTSLMPLVIGIVIMVVGYMAMKLVLNIQRIAPHKPEPTPVAQASVSAPVATPAATVAVVAPTVAPTQAPKVVAAPATPAASIAPNASATATATAAPIAAASATASAAPAAAEPEVRRAQPVRPEDLVKTTTAESSGPNHISIRPLKKTYIKVVVDNSASTPAFERWIAPENGPVDFKGQHFSVRVLDREAVQIKKNGKTVAPDDADVTIE